MIAGRALALLVTGAAIAATVGVARPLEVRAGVPHPGDFDGDGRVDLAVGAPNDDVAGLAQAGVVNVLYSTASGPTGANSEVWHQNRLNNLGGTAERSEEGDHFGAALALGDFDGDGRSDLAIGAPGEDTTGPPVKPDFGVVHILYGSPSGLIVKEAFDKFGGTSGDSFGAGLVGLDYFDNGEGHGSDGITDLAIGRPGTFAGAVFITEVGADGVADDNDLRESLLCPTIPGVTSCGEVMTAGHFDTELGEDLVIGVPEATVTVAGTDRVAAGAVVLVQQGDVRVLTQQTSGVPGNAAAGDRFGAAVAAGDFAGSSLDELLVGAPGEDELSGGLTVADAGQVFVFLGGTFVTTLHEGQTEVPDTAEAGDAFGSSLALGDFGGDGALELAIGVPGERVGGFEGAGAVDVLYGPGLTDQRWTQSSAGVPGAAQRNDRFGAVLFGARFTFSQHDDLAIGVPRDRVSGQARAGAVQMLYGSEAGGLVIGGGSSLLHQDSPSVGESAQVDDRFGSTIR